SCASARDDDKLTNRRPPITEYPNFFTNRPTFITETSSTSVRKRDPNLSNRYIENGWEKATGPQERALAAYQLVRCVSAVKQVQADCRTQHETMLGSAARSELCWQRRIRRQCGSGGDFEPPTRHMPWRPCCATREAVGQAHARTVVAYQDATGHLRSSHGS